MATSHNSLKSQEVQEIWKPVPSLDGYAASATGNVENVTRNRLLTPCKHHSGYLVVTIKKRSKLVHRLVAEAFMGECPKGLEVNHKDGNKANNQISNLEYITRSQNQSHAIQMGLRNRIWGCAVQNQKLTEEDVSQIKIRLRQGDSQAQIGRDYGVSKYCIHSIANGDNWKHIK